MRLVVSTTNKIDPARSAQMSLVRGKDTKGNDVPLYGELVAVREDLPAEASAQAGPC